MKLALVSSVKVECGIASYTDYLGTALQARGHEVRVFGCTLDECATYYSRGTMLPYQRCWTREGNYAVLVEVLAAYKPDVTHIQHEYGLHRDPTAFVNWMKLQPKPLVVTFHTVPIPGHEQAKQLDWFPKALTQSRTYAIAHQIHGAEALRSYGVPHVHCIPHGTCGPYPLASGEQRTEARRRLSLPPSGIVGATLGFWTPGKRNEQTIAAIVRLLQRDRLPKGFTFVIAGQPMGREAERDMLEACARLERIGLADAIRIRPGFVDDALLADYYAATDFTVANSGPTMYSITGRGHVAMAFGSPVLAAEFPLLEEFRQCGLTFSTHAGLEDGLVRLATDEDLRQDLRLKARAHAEQTSWARVAEMHEAVYEEAVA